MNIKYSIMVCTCDKYEKIWPVFFDMFHRFWPQCTGEIYLNTEKKTFQHSSLSIIPCNCPDEEVAKSWSRRLINALNQIDTNLVLMVLDDFIFEKKVDDETFQMTLERMNGNKDIGMMQFTVGSDKGILDDTYPNWKEQISGIEYRINCQIAIWRKDYLLKILRLNESPWEFEHYGSIRSKKYKEKVYSWASEKNYVFTYNWGKPIIGGKWNLDEVDRLEEKLGIEFDLSGRETMRNYYEYMKNKPKPKHDIHWILMKIKHWKSYF